MCYLEDLKHEGDSMYYSTSTYVRGSQTFDTNKRSVEIGIVNRRPWIIKSKLKQLILTITCVASRSV